MIENLCDDVHEMDGKYMNKNETLNEKIKNICNIK